VCPRGPPEMRYSLALSPSVRPSLPTYLFTTTTHRPPVVWGGTSPSTLTDTRLLCFEVEKHALRLGASAHYLPTNWGPPPRTGLPVNNVRQRGQTGPYTQHKRDGVPPRNETKAVAMSLVTPDLPLN